MKFELQLGLGLIALSSCGPRWNAQQPVNNSTKPEIPVPSAPPALKSTASRSQPSKDPATLSESNSPIDPKSVEAAGDVVRQYGALIEQNQLFRAAGLWSDAGAAEDFAKHLDRPQVHLQIGALGQTEGAAGSIYTSVPAVFYGAGFRRPAKIILRRVNDVPGSTEAQRRWHIERIEWDSPG